MRILAACVLGYILDCIFGDPYWLYHPVRIIGNGITFVERGLRKIVNEKETSLLVAGGILWLLIVGGSVGIPWFFLKVADRIHPLFGFALETFWCYQLLAGRSLKTESRKVYQELKDQDLEGARYAVSMIVGRDTKDLTEEGVTKAAVETVAENTSDGVIAPMIYMLMGGAVAGFLYKAVNTMDSMIGYKNERYLYFGRVAAKMDDIFNYIPARMSAVFMILGAGLIGFDQKQAWKIYKRDGRKHASPNAAQTESVCAGALHIQLAGDAWYFGKRYKKDTIGNPIRPIEIDDIIKAGMLMDITAILTLLFCGVIRLILVMI